MGRFSTVTGNSTGNFLPDPKSLLLRFSLIERHGLPLIVLALRNDYPGCGFERTAAP